MYTFEQIHNYLLCRVNNLSLKEISVRTSLHTAIIKRLNKMLLNDSINKFYVDLYDKKLSELSREYDNLDKQDIDKIDAITNKFDEYGAIKWFLVDLIKERCYE